MKFIADHMLGRLVTWMRMIGCDVVYAPGVEDAPLLRQARRAERILLTRDTRLVQRREARECAFFVRGDRYPEQLREVVRHFAIDPRRDFLTRCLRCNDLLSRIDREEAKGKVPPYVFESQEIFDRCPACGRIYWGATHRERMLRELDTILSSQ
ncbi:MAG: Mut7-C RNAse domain-containing protein [Nitrospirae bacterium]|nr:Mut7-C RNAse domain-containing protein [Nitrospirota bacterium]